MTTYLRNVLLWLCVILSINGYGQQSESFGLHDCIMYAVENNREIKKAHLEIEQQQEFTKEVRSDAYPTVDFTSSYSDNLLLPILVVPGELTGGSPGEVQTLEIGTQYGLFMGLTANQKLYDQSVFIAMKAARKGQEFFQNKQQKVEEEVVAAIASGYYQTLILERNIQVLKVNLDQTNKLIKISEVRLANGLINKVDLDRLLVSRTNLETQVNDLILSKRLQIKRLKYIMGMPLDQPLELTDNGGTNPELLAVIPDFESSSRIDMKLLGTQIELNDLNVKNIRSGYFPELSLFANYSYQGISDDAFFAGSESSTNWYDVSAIGLRLQVPIFDGFNRKAKVSQALIQMRMLEEDLKDTESSLSLEHAQASEQYNQSRLSLESRQANVDLAREVYNITQETYNQGGADLTDVLSAETALTESELNYSSALLNLKLSEIALLKASGKLLETLKP